MRRKPLALAMGRVQSYNIQPLRIIYTYGLVGAASPPIYHKISATIIGLTFRAGVSHQLDLCAGGDNMGIILSGELVEK